MVGKLLVKYDHFVGEHCETTATGNLLYQQGLRLSEPMMFGLGEGLGFIFLNLQSLNLPFIGGRSKPFELTTRLCENLGIELQASETSSKAKALEILREPLAEGRPVGVQLDSYFLDYFTTKIHFAGHFVAVFGIEDKDAWVIDTRQQGQEHRVRLSDLEKARFEKGPMSAKARTWNLRVKKKDPDLRAPIQSAIRENATKYLKPEFKGMSYLGIEKMAKSLPKWIELAKSPKKDLALSAAMMERAGTGGSIFRCFYRDFLKESQALLKSKNLDQGHQAFCGIADDWRTVAELIDEAGASGKQDPLLKASKLCQTLATREKDAMGLLSAI